MSTLPSSPESESHTYPPSPAPIVPQATTEEDPSSECLLCLSSPREVVLLPCRHLVACKDCALNMVEFGAGGNITQPTAAEEPTTPASGTETAADGTTVANRTGTAATTATSPISPTNPRRKRKAKGWFCPVCRQRKSSCMTNLPGCSLTLFHSLHVAFEDYDESPAANGGGRQGSVDVRGR